MASLDEQVLRTVKEIIVKFIEAGRISPAAFHDTFKQVYQTVAETVHLEPNRKSEEKTEKSEQSQ
jgi:hypothetical protein